jgi:hypothetical protein
VNPNSSHQRWSFWQYRVYPDPAHRPSFWAVKPSAARFGRLMFGSVSEMKIEQATDDTGRLYWQISILSEGHPVHDPLYVGWMHTQWGRFLREGFGHSCEIRSHARLEAGDRQDGTPADQLIVVPSIDLKECC